MSATKRFLYVINSHSSDVRVGAACYYRLVSRSELLLSGLGAVVLAAAAAAAAAAVVVVVVVVLALAG
ncbi:hypothetical protein INR49_020533 [Caranx melampygus]|nr:hypothetical protein INR49_020533 [Caranx melampygus]